MRIDYKTGEGGTGINIELTREEVALAVYAWLTAHGVHITGPRTVRVNGGLCESGNVYVDPSGSAIVNGVYVLGSNIKEYY